MLSHAPLLTLAATLLTANGQWLNYPDAGIPRTRDGKPDLSAQTPRAGNRPDLSGVWRTVPSPREELVLLFGPSIEALDSPGSTAGALN